MHTRLPDWPPGKVQDPVQRARNLLYIAAVPDVLQTPIERFTPLEIYDYLQQAIPKPQLIQVLFWIALHPMDGDDSAIEQLPGIGDELSPDRRRRDSQQGGILRGQNARTPDRKSDAEVTAG